MLVYLNLVLFKMLYVKDFLKNNLKFTKYKIETGLIICSILLDVLRSR